MFKIFLLSWAVLANSLGAHSLADNIQKPYSAPVASVQASGIDNLIDSLPQIKPQPLLQNRDKLKVAADAWLVRDSNSGVVLAEKNGFVKRPAASTIKPMTALLVMENVAFDLDVTISERATSQPGSSAGLKTGESVTVLSLLYGLLLNSGNDAGVALAEASQKDGGYDAFIKSMNERANTIGLSDTRFNDPHGYDESGTVSTPFDITKMLDYALNVQPKLSKLMITKDYEYRDVAGKNPRLLRNSNRFVQFDYPGIIGGKTGTGSHRSLGGAGHSIVACAEQNSRRLCAFVGGTFSDSPSASYEEAKKLLDFTFGNTQWQ